MRVELLGPVRVLRADGEDVTPRAAQQRAALAALAASGPDGLMVDDLIELLWPDGSPSPNALQAVLSKLRKTVAPLDVRLERGRYALHGDRITDLDEIEQHHASGTFAAVEALVRGAAVPEMGEHPLATAIRDRVATFVAEARARRLEAAVRGERPDAAIAELRQLATADPFDERWWALQMVAQYRMGNQAAALRLYQEARITLAEGLGLEPGPTLRSLERQIIDHDDALAPPVGRGPYSRSLPSRALPARLSSFVGRTGELTEIEQLTRRHRLVTLVGPGGVGKTTTSLEVARRTPEAVFVELAPQADRESAVRAFARGIGLPDVEQAGLSAVAASDQLDRVVDALSSSAALLVVDNCEHVVAEVAAIVHRVLVACAGVRVLATSREALGVPGEYTYALPPLPTTDAVELFVERARAHAAGAAVDLADPARLAELCDRLDGLPLAIELAAARLRTNSVAELIGRLDDRFAVLSSGARTVEPRQQTLRAVVDWSHDLLDAEERVVFRRLAAFVGGATPAAAAAACSGAAPDGAFVDHDGVTDVVQRLVDKSLVVVEHTPDGPRWTMLETLRDYAFERLAASGERERVLIRHAQHLADFLAPASRGLLGHDQPGWFARIGRERRNVDAALATALARDDAQLALELTAPLGWYFYMVGELDTGASALREALACSGPTEPDLRAVALGLYGWLLANGPLVEEAVAATTEATSLLGQVHDPWVRGMVANTHVMALFFAGHLDMVETLLPEVRAIADAADDGWITAITDLVEGELLQFRGAPVAAEEAFLAAAAAFEREGDQFAYALAISEASEIAELLGDYDRAVDLVRRALAIADEVGFSGHPLAMRARLGNIEILRGNLEIAERLHRSLLDDPVAMGVHWLQSMAWIGLGSIARRRGDFDEAAQQIGRAWALPRTQTVPYMRTIALVALGYLADQRGDAAAALEHQIAGLDTATLLQTPRGVAYAFEGVAGALAASADAHRHRLAAQLYGHADRLRRESGGPMPLAERFDVDRGEARARDALGDDAFDECFAAGATATSERLLAAIDAVRPTN